jgi:hypothetical protein
MAARKYALVAGILYVVIAVLSLNPSFSTHPAWLPSIKLDVSYGLFLNEFVQNIVNKVALLLFGIAGIVVARVGAPEDAERHSIIFARTVCFVMGGAAILGFIHPTQNLFRIWPLWGAEAIFHAVNALIGGYVGFFYAHFIERVRHA